MYDISGDLLKANVEIGDILFRILYEIHQNMSNMSIQLGSTKGGIGYVYRLESQELQNI